MLFQFEKRNSASKALIFATPFIAIAVTVLLSSVMLLRHISLGSHADKIESALLSTLSEGKYLTGDLGGTATTTAFTNEVCSKI